MKNLVVEVFMLLNPAKTKTLISKINVRDIIEIWIRIR